MADFPKIPGYRIEKELGRGGMAEVWRARDTVLSRTVGMSVSEIRSFAFVSECFGTVATVAGPETYFPDGEVEFSDIEELRRLAP